MTGVHQELIRRAAPDWVSDELIQSALAGDVEAVNYLFFMLHGYQRGWVAWLLYQARISPASMRAALINAMLPDCFRGGFQKLAGREFITILRYAEFPLPALPNVITIWRGTFSKATRPRVKKGYFWTIDREVAVFFAKRFEFFGGRPMLMRAEVCAEDIVFYSNERNEQEVIPTVSPPLGTKATWIE